MNLQLLLVCVIVGELFVFVLEAVVLGSTVTEIETHVPPEAQTFIVEAPVLTPVMVNVDPLIMALKIVPVFVGIQYELYPIELDRLQETVCPTFTIGFNTMPPVAVVPELPTVT